MRGFPFLLLCLLSAATVYAGRRDEADFDLELLLKLGRQKTTADVSKYLGKDFGVKVLEIPERSGSQRHYGSDAWLYTHYPDMEDFAGAYLPAYEAIPLDLDGTGIEELDYPDRPYGHQDLILLREGSPREILLHEAAHFLMEKKRREKAGMDAQSFSRACEVTADSASEAIALVLSERRRTLNEEQVINRALIENAKALGMDRAGVQLFGAALLNDIDHYTELARKMLTFVVEKLRGMDEPNLDRYVEESLAAIARWEKDERADLEDYFFRNKATGMLAKLGARRVRLADPDFDGNSRAVLGIVTDEPLDEGSVRLAHRYWSKIYHPDVGGDATKFNQLQLAMDRLLNGEPLQWDEVFGEGFRSRSAQMWAEFEEAKRKQEAEGERAVRRLRRWGARVATQCAAGAALCLIDRDGILSAYSPLEWQSWVMYVSLASISGSPQDDPVEKPVSQGIRGGLKRAAVWATCSKAFEVLFRVTH